MDESKKRKGDSLDNEQNPTKKQKAEQISKIVFPDGAHLRAVFTKLQKFSAEVDMIVEPTGVKINTMDSAKTNVLALCWGSEYFTEYDVQRGAVLGLSLTEVNQYVMPRIEGPISLSFNAVRPDQVLFRFSSRLKEQKKVESLMDDNQPSNTTSGLHNNKILLKLLDLKTEESDEFSMDEIPDEFILASFRMDATPAKVVLPEIIDKQDLMENYLIFKDQKWYGILKGALLEKPIALPTLNIKDGPMFGVQIAKQTFHKVNSFLAIYDYVEVTLLKLNINDPDAITIWWKFGFFGGGPNKVCRMDFVSAAKASEFQDEETGELNTNHHLFSLVSEERD
uniref:PCNA n=1 Tax=Clandestinovirus TaxID=2831644 RepID=A0A8F8PK31_9VIRU|nr:PCNA [Clandestinovirus]